MRQVKRKDDENEIVASQFVQESLHQLLQLYRVGLPHESCMSFIEGFLRTIVLKSRLVADFLDDHPGANAQKEQIAAGLRMPVSDINLLLRVGGAEWAGPAVEPSSDTNGGGDSGFSPKLFSYLPSTPFMTI